MNPKPTPRNTVNGGAGPLDAAVQQLRSHTDRRWVEIESDLLAGLMSVSRPSHPLHTMSSTGPYAVGEQVLVAYLQVALDRVANCEVSTIAVHAEDDGDYGATCTGVTIVVTARYGYSLIDIGDAIRFAADEVIAEVLGDARPRVTVTDMHVHVNDITRGDPKRGEL